MAISPQRSPALAQPPFDALADIYRYVILRDHFVGGRAVDDTVVAGVGELGWSVTDAVGAADSDVDFVTTASIVQGHPGVISLNTGPTTPAANDEASLFLPNVDALILPDGTDQALYVASLVYFPSIASIEFNFGLFDAANAAGRGVNSVSAEFDASADAEWNLVVVDGSSATAVASSIPVAAATWYLVEIAAHEDEVQLWINKELAASTTSADIPDDEGVGPGFKVATETTAEKSVYIDSFMLRAKIS